MGKAKMTIAIERDLLHHLRGRIPRQGRSRFVAEAIQRSLEELEAEELEREYQEAYAEMASDLETFEGVTGDGID